MSLSRNCKSRYFRKAGVAHWPHSSNLANGVPASCMSLACPLLRSCVRYNSKFEKPIASSIALSACKAPALVQSGKSCSPKALSPMKAPRTYPSELAAPQTVLSLPQGNANTIVFTCHMLQASSHMPTQMKAMGPEGNACCKRKAHTHKGRPHDDATKAIPASGFESPASARKAMHARSNKPHADVPRTIHASGIIHLCRHQPHTDVAGTIHATGYIVTCQSPEDDACIKRRVHTQGRAVCENPEDGMCYRQQAHTPNLSHMSKSRSR